MINNYLFHNRTKINQYELSQIDMGTNYYPIVLTCQMHTDYTVNAHDILIFESFSVVFVRTIISNWMFLYSSSVSYSRHGLL